MHSLDQIQNGSKSFTQQRYSLIHWILSKHKQLNYSKNWQNPKFIHTLTKNQIANEYEDGDEKKTEHISNGR